MSTTRLILQRIAEHGNIVEEYDALEHTHTELEHSTKLISDLERALDTASKRYRELEITTIKERANHDSIRNSTVRKLVYTITGKRSSFELKASIEEKEYIQALQEEYEEKARVEMCQQRLAEAYVNHTSVQQRSEMFYYTQTRLDSFYDSIFSGSTLEFPDEDALEDRISASFAAVAGLKEEIDAEKRVLELLGAAQANVADALVQAQTVLHRSRDYIYDREFVIGYRRGTAFEQARILKDEAYALFRRAQCIQPRVELFDDKDLFSSQSDDWLDYSYDEEFESRSYHHSIKLTKEKLAVAWEQVEMQVVASGQRLRVLQGQIKLAEKDWEVARKDLRDARRRIFERVAGVDIPPPKYCQEASSRITLPRPLKM